MKRTILISTALLAAGVLLSGCTATASTGTAQQNAEQPAGPTGQTGTVASFTGDLDPVSVLADNIDYTTVNEDEWSASETVTVALNGSGLATGDAGSVAGVTAEGGTVTIAQGGVYRLSGSLDGQIRVAAADDDLVVLMLDGLTVTSSSGAAIEVVSADDVAIHLFAGSTNTVTDAATYADDAAANAAIWADTDLTISGGGELIVNARANDGITSRDDLVILGGSITVTAVDDALRGKDALAVEGGTLRLLAAGGDGLKSDGDEDAAAEFGDVDWSRGYIVVSGGEISIEAGDDGLQAFTDTVITGGTVTAAVADDGVKGEVIVSIGGDAVVTVTESEEGIEAANIGIFDGVIDVTAADDGINASGNAELQAMIAGVEFGGVANREADTGERLEISGGIVTVAAGFDGLDSNGSIAITGGTVTITSAARGGDAPIDANGAVSVAAGTVTANGEPWDESMAQMGSGGMGAPGGPGGPGGPRR